MFYGITGWARTLFHLVGKKKSFGQSSRNYLTNDYKVQSRHFPWIFSRAWRNDKKSFLAHNDDGAGIWKSRGEKHNNNTVIVISPFAENNNHAHSRWLKAAFVRSLALNMAAAH